MSEISTTFAVEISVEFAKAVNELAIDDSISPDPASMLTSKIAVNSATAATVSFVTEARLVDLALELETSVILRSGAVSPGENNI